MADGALLARPSVRDVLTQISRGGEGLSTTVEDATRAALARLAAAAPMPWYLRFLIGAGAWVGASFLLSAILGLILLASGERLNSVAFVLGCLFIMASVLLRRRVNTPFLTQLALVVSSTGQILVIGAVGSATHSVIAGGISAIVSSSVLIVWFPDRVQRFSATLVVFGALAVVIADHRIAHGMDAMALVVLVLTLSLWRFAPRGFTLEHADLVEPIGYGLVIALLGVLATHTIVMMANLHEVGWLRLGPMSIVAFIVALLALAAAIFVEHGVQLVRVEAMAAFAGIVLLGAITRSTPAIVATVLLLVLGFDRRARTLIALATVFFLGFGAAFYYDLQLTLLQKSGILMLSGALCLAAWAVVRTRRG
jgi:hypothetical protein